MMFTVARGRLCWPASGTAAVAWGWGYPHNNATSCPARGVALTIVPSADCAAWSAEHDLDAGLFVCTLPADVANTCDGDSGGPLLVERAGVADLVGITSSGPGCGPHDPGVSGSPARAAGPPTGTAAVNPVTAAPGEVSRPKHPQTG